MVIQRPQVLWKDSRLGLDPDGGRSCLGDTLRGTTDSLRGGVVDENSWKNVISGVEKVVLTGRGLDAGRCAGRVDVGET